MEFDQEKMERNCLISTILLGVLIYPGFLWVDIQRGNIQHKNYFLFIGTGKPNFK